MLALEFELGAIVARVQGTRRTPYEVRIEVARFAQAEWLRVAESLAARASYRAQLLAGTMPDDIEAVFARLGLTLFPAIEDDLVISCTCSDWATPCRHAAAACHVAGEALDREPFLALRLRGIERDVLLALVQGTVPSVAGADVDAGEVVPADAAGPPVESDLAAFWEGRDVEVPELGVAASLDLQPPPMDAPLIHVLGAVPMWRGVDDFVPVMRLLHRRIGTSSPALDVALGLGLDAPEGEAR
ncbi:MAG: family helicase [Thermoleophilia bacterium]|nr:family helicase [Thermoleophilia bacterium]